MLKLFKNCNILRNHQTCLFKPQHGWKALQTSSWHTQQSMDHQAETSKNRVYYGSLTPNIRSVKVFSLSTSIAGVMAQPILYEQAAKLGSSTPVIAAVCGFVGFFTFVTPFLLHVVTKRYVTELDYNQLTNEYTATTISFFLRRKKLTFKTEDVIVPEIPGMFTSFLVNKQNSQKKPVALFVEPKTFEDPSHYVRIMGYDKPIDFKLDVKEKKI